MSSLLDCVKDAVTYVLGRSIPVTPETKLSDHLVESLDIVSFEFRISDTKPAFEKFEIPQDRWGELTAGDVAAMLEQYEPGGT